MIGVFWLSDADLLAAAASRPNPPGYRFPCLPRRSGLQQTALGGNRPTQRLDPHSGRRH